MKNTLFERWKEWQVPIFVVSMLLILGSVFIATALYRSAHWEDLAYMRTYEFPAQYKNSYIFITVLKNNPDETQSLEKILLENDYKPIEGRAIPVKIGWVCDLNESNRYCKLTDEQGFFVVSESLNMKMSNVDALKYVIELMSTPRTRNSM